MPALIPDQTTLQTVTQPILVSLTKFTTPPKPIDVTKLIQTATTIKNIETTQYYTTRIAHAELATSSLKTKQQPAYTSTLPTALTKLR